MIGLFDYDSLIYKSVYKIVGFKEIRKWFNENRSKEWMEKEITLLASNRVTAMGDEIFHAIEECGVEDLKAEYYITHGDKSERKRRYPSYKSNRKFNRMSKWVNLVRQAFIDKFDGLLESQVFLQERYHDPLWEADDLIADRTRQLGEDEYIIISLDKDLKQLGGYVFDYYKKPLIINFEPVYDEYGKPVRVFRGLSYISPLQARRFFWTQMLTGDSGDGVKGIKGLGVVKAGLKISPYTQEAEMRECVERIYFEFYGESVWLDEFEKAYFLLGLGTGR